MRGPRGSVAYIAQIRDLGLRGCMGRGGVNAPFAMAEKAAKLKGGNLRAFEEETHLSLPYNHSGEIIKEILKL